MEMANVFHGKIFLDMVIILKKKKSQTICQYLQNEERSRVLDFLKKLADLATVNFHFPTAAKLLQLCPTLCDPIDGSPPGSPVPGILQARTLEWVAIPSPAHKSEK